jgi:hypothetical protein
MPIIFITGYGDAVIPGVEEVEYPTMLDDVPTPRLLAYPRASVFPEKLEAIASLGLANTRMKDYFDLPALAREGTLDTAVLGDAIAATFARRGTPLPEGLPFGLTGKFAQDAAKRAQWQAFLDKNGLAGPPLDRVVTEVGEGRADANDASAPARGVRWSRIRSRLLRLWAAAAMRRLPEGSRSPHRVTDTRTALCDRVDAMVIARATLITLSP